MGRLGNFFKYLSYVDETEPLVESLEPVETKNSRASEGMAEDTNRNVTPEGRYSSTANPPGFGDLSIRGDEPYEILLNKYSRSPWVYIAVNTIVTALSQVEFRVADKRKKGRPDEIVQGPANGLNDLMDNPNPWFSEPEFKELIGMHLLLTGNAYIELAEVDSLGKPHELYVLNPKNMVVIQDNKKFIKEYRYIVNKTEVKFKPNEIIHIKLPDPRGESRYGLSPISCARIIIQQDFDALDWNSAYFKNATWPSGIITCKDGLNENEFKRAKKELKQNYEGKSKVGKVLILAGGMEWHQTTPNPKDLDFLNLRKFTREEILSIYRVPPSIAGIFQFENSTSRSAGVREQHIQFWSQTVQPLAKKIISKLNMQLTPLFGKNFELILDVSNIPALKETEEMKKTRADTAAILVEKIGWTPAAANALLFPEAVAFPWGDKPSPTYNSFSGTFADIEGKGIPTLPIDTQLEDKQDAAAEQASQDSQPQDSQTQDTQNDSSE